MQIVAKTIPDKKQIDSKVSLGFNTFEVQLTDDIVRNEDVNVLQRDDIDIIGVHTPLGRNCTYNDICINQLFVEYQFDILKDTCQLAEILSIYYKHDIYVVIHNELSKKQWNADMGLKSLVPYFSVLLNHFPHIKFAIENSVNVVENGTFTPVLSEDNYYVCSVLNEEMKTDKFFVLIDTCHYLMESKVSGILNRYGYPYKKETIEELFKNTKNLCKVIHLSNFRNMGYKKDHGLPFTNTKEDRETLQDIVFYTMMYADDAYIVLEIQETDYITCPNLIQMNKELTRAIDGKNDEYEEELSTSTKEDNTINKEKSNEDDIESLIDEYMEQKEGLVVESSSVDNSNSDAFSMDDLLSDIESDNEDNNENASTETKPQIIEKVEDLIDSNDEIPFTLDDDEIEFTKDIKKEEQKDDDLIEAFFDNKPLHKEERKTTKTSSPASVIVEQESFDGDSFDDNMFPY